MNAGNRTESIGYGPLCFLRGVGYIVGTPRGWPLAIVPVLVSLAVFAIAAYFGIHEVNRHLPTPSASNDMAVISLAFVHVLLILLVLVAAFFVSVTLAQPLSGPALDALCQRRWAVLGGEAPPDTGWLSGVARSLRVTLAGLVVGVAFIVPLSVVTMLVPPAAVVTVPLKLIVAAFVIAWDVLDYPLSLQGLRVRDRIRFIREHARHVLAFGFMCELAFLIPGVGLLVLPMAASGATDLFFGLREVPRPAPALA